MKRTVDCGLRSYYKYNCIEHIVVIIYKVISSELFR